MPEPAANLKATDPELVQPIPPRFWWLKRVAVAILVLVLVLTVARWWWGAYATRALQAEIDRLRAAGEPMDGKDFDLPAIPDAQNAAIPLKEAAAIQDQLDKQAARTRRQRSSTTMPEDPAQAQARAEAVARIRELVHQARLRPGVNWGLRDRNLDSLPPNLIPYPQIIKTLSETAIAAHKTGDETAAMEILEDMLALGERVSAIRGLLAGLLQNVASDQVASALEQMLPDLRVADRRATSPALRTPSRERITALTSRLLEERPLREGIIWGMQRERLFQLQSIQLVASDSTYAITGRGGTWNRVNPWPFLSRPMFQLDGVRILRTASAWVDVARARNLPEAQSREPNLNTLGLKNLGRGLRMQSRLLSMIVIPNFSGTEDKWFESLARRRMAAVALAVRLYQADRGKLPTTLDELVPDYLPFIPENPLVSDVALIQYDPQPNSPHLFCFCAKSPQQGSPVSAGGSPDTRSAAGAGIRFYLKGKPPERNASRPATSPVSRAS